MFGCQCFLYFVLPALGIAQRGLFSSPTQHLYGNSFGVSGQDATFDYAILGGGTAGLAIAGRLAANPDVSVAVIEAGGFYEIDNGNGSVIPALAPSQHVGSLPNITQPLIDWGFVTVPQVGANNRRLHYARGKTLGGTSALNYLGYHRGSNGSYQQWVNQVGDDSYQYPNFLQYFQRCHVTPPNLDKRNSPNDTVGFNPAAFNNSIGGPLQISWANNVPPIGSWARKALTSAGILPIDGFDSGNLFGSSWFANTLNPVNQQRSSSQTSYVVQAIQNTSIVVYPRSLGKQILFDSNKTAKGVSVETVGLQYTISARKEVILSAGVFQSPQMLMLSGIGPAETLKRHNISVISDRPSVGQNLWDQPYFGVSFRVNADTASRLANDKAYAAQAAEDYLVNQTGPLTGGGAYIGFERLPLPYRQNFTASTKSRLASIFASDWPEIEYLAVGSFNGYNKTYTDILPHDEYQYATISAALVAPLSRGNVTISSADAADPPVINPNWLTDPADVEVAIAAFKRLREIWQYMNGTTIGPEYFPGTNNVSTDAEILDFIGESVVQIWHAATTCRMGKVNDPMAVIDSQARVIGVKGLRVVDASSFPLLPPGHPQSTIYALAEKIADDILKVE